MPTPRKLLSVFLLLSSVIAIVSTAHANSVSVTGYEVAGLDVNSFVLTAGSFYGGSGAPGGPGTFSDAFPLGVEQMFTWGSSAYTGPDLTFVQVGNQVTDILTGGIIFKSTFTIPASALVAGVFTAPVSVMGEVTAYQDLTLGQGEFTQGPLMAILKFSGTGLGTFQLEDAGQGLVVISVARVDFTDQGTLTTVVPEPTSLLLMGTGISSLLGLARFKRVLGS